MLIFKYNAILDTITHNGKSIGEVRAKWNEKFNLD